MKATVEHYVQFFSLRQYESALSEFNRILTHVTQSADEENLRKCMKEMSDTEHELNHFVYGFGSNHMWVTQKNPLFDRLCHNRCLIVTF